MPTEIEWPACLCGNITCRTCFPKPPEDYMLERVRASLQARLEGRNEGGDIEVMRLVDEIVEKAFQDHVKEGGTMNF